MPILLQCSGHIDPNADDFTQIVYACSRFGASQADNSSRIVVRNSAPRRRRYNSLQQKLGSGYLQSYSCMMSISNAPALRLLVLLVTGVSVAGCSRHESPSGGDRPLDQAPERSVDFVCDANGPISVRFPGSEAVELSWSGETQVLNRLPTASGGRYVAGQTEFWNKGDEAMLVFGDSRDTCRKETA